MKKLLALLLACVMLLSLTACGTSSTEIRNNGEENFYTTTTIKSTTTAPKKDDWVLKYYVDEFDQPTSDWYVTNNEYIVGKFSNSATTNSSLYVQVLIDSEDVCFMLYEYGRSQVKNSYSKSRYYDIRMKDANGVEHDLEGGIIAGGDRIALLESSRQKVLSAFKQSGTLSFYIVQSDRTTTKYLFSLETSNLGELIK